MTIRFFILAGVAAGGSVAWAQAPEAYDLEACVRSGLQRNLALQNLSLDVLRAEADIDITRSVYDERISVLGRYEDSELTNQNVPVQGASKSLVFGGGLSRRLSTGTGLSLEASSTQIDFAESFSPVNPLHISSLTLDLDHPLWGGGGAEDRARIQLSESTRDAIALQFHVQQDQVAAEIEDAYWLAFLARRQYAVNQGALRRGRELLDNNRIRFQEGLLDETDILAAEAALALREVDLINLSNACAVAEDQLRDRMNLPPDQWEEVAFRFSEPGRLDTPALAGDLVAAQAIALRRRPELLLLQARAQRAADEVALRREQVKGGLSLIGRLGVGETAGEWGDSLEPAKSLWGVGLRYESSLGRDAERSRLRQAELEVRRVQNQHQDALRTIAGQIRRAVRSLETATRRVDATRSAQDLQFRKLELERRKFDQGRSSTRDLIEYQDDLAFAEYRTLEAFALQRRAWIELRLAQGTIIEPPGPGEDGP